MEKTLEQLKKNCLKVVLFGPESTENNPPGN